MERVVFRLKINGETVINKKLRWVNPANMVRISINITNDLIGNSGEVEASLYGG